MAKSSLMSSSFASWLITSDVNTEPKSDSILAGIYACWRKMLINAFAVAVAVTVRRGRAKRNFENTSIAVRIHRYPLALFIGPTMSTCISSVGVPICVTTLCSGVFTLASGVRLTWQHDKQFLT